jgi:hypothetical protein
VGIGTNDDMRGVGGIRNHKICFSKIVFVCVGASFVKAENNELFHGLLVLDIVANI